jgi:hypothetical protein
MPAWGTAHFDGEWHAGKRVRGVWKPDKYWTFNGSFVDDRLHGPVRFVDGPGHRVYSLVYDMGRVVSRQLEGVWEG